MRVTSQWQPYLVGIGSVAFAGLHQPARAADAGATVTLQEIVITATKRPETLQDVPIAVSAISGDSIQQQGIAQFTDYVALVPGLEQNNTGAAGHGQVILRGLSSGNSQSGSTVAFVLDDIPFTANTSAGDSALITPDPELADIERIEVLKGPQGTLYGASALGGIIKIVSKQPDLNDFSADFHGTLASADGGGYGGGARGSLNIPLVSDVAALRVSAFERTDPGFMKNVETGFDNVNRTQVSGGKLMLKIQPNADLQILFTGLLQNLHTDAAAAVDTNSTTLTPLYCRYCYAAPTGWTFDTQYRLAGMTVNWNTPYGTLTNALSYARYSDVEAVENHAFGFVDSQLPVPPDTVAIASPRPSMDKLTEELRFALTRIGNFEALGGVYFTTEHSGYDISLTNINPGTLHPVAPPFDNMLNVNTSPLYKEYALFTNLTYYLTSSLDVTAGVRLSHDQQSASTASSGLLIGTPTLTEFSSSENPITYLGTLRYRVTESLDTYARFATGYRPGGPQLTSGAGIPSSFAPDKTKNYELGAKGRWLEGRLAANFDLYYIDWNDIQLNEIVDGLTITGNGGRATSRGAELDVSYLPVRNLTTQVTASYGHAYSNVAVPAVGAEAGDTLPFAPRFSGALLADYAFPIVGPVQGNVGATFSYQGYRPTSFSNDDINVNANLPGYGTLNLRTGVEWSRYSLEFRVNNVTDKYAYTTSSVQNLFAGQGAPASSVVLAPRILFLDFNAKF
jgi:outer membrane receptor protein involved in Fe transport